MAHFKNVRVLCVAACMLTAGAANAAAWTSASGSQYQRLGRHSVVTIGKGTSPGSRVDFRDRGVKTFTQKSVRLTPDRPISGELRRAQGLKAQERSSLRWRRVETVSKSGSALRNEVSSVTRMTSASMHQVWTTQGDKAQQ